MGKPSCHYPKGTAGVGVKDYVKLRELVINYEKSLLTIKKYDTINNNSNICSRGRK